MQIDNKMIEKQLEHRTIREFKKDAIPNDILNQLFDVAKRTATSTGIQASSIIRITDQRIKEEIAGVCKQEYVGRAPELFIFIVDQFRNNQIAMEKGCTLNGASDLDRFFSAFTDACIIAQNMVVAAEAMNLGAVYLGSILNDSEQLCSILKLPKLTFPVVGLGIGYPNQSPMLKPRMDMKYRIFENEYQVFDNYLEELEEYDKEMQTYYDLRDANRHVDSFTNQIVARLSQQIPKRNDILKILKKQGFKLDYND